MLVKVVLVLVLALALAIIVLVLVLLVNKLCAILVQVKVATVYIMVYIVYITGE